MTNGRTTNGQPPMAQWAKGECWHVPQWAVCSAQSASRWVRPAALWATGAAALGARPLGLWRRRQPAPRPFSLFPSDRKPRVRDGRRPTGPPRGSQGHSRALEIPNHTCSPRWGQPSGERWACEKGVFSGPRGAARTFSPAAPCKKYRRSPAYGRRRRRGGTVPGRRAELSAITTLVRSARAS